MQSAATLILDPKIKVTINALRVFVAIGSITYMVYGVILIVLGEKVDGHEFDCHNKEFIIQNSLLIFILIIFYYFACKVNAEINKLLSQAASVLDERNLLLTKTRKAAMRNIWALLIWLSVVAVEAQVYSICGYYMSGEQC